ncbi:MAG: glycosyltransferase, partial [Bacteroidota bacterium]|nr:glycosyltransferase [Bacteroidota bacterium]
ARYDVSPLFRNEAFRGKVHRTGYVDEAALSALYAHARALVFPSLYEGFGFPVLDAMAHGTPVLCSSRASLPEVAGDAALYVDPENTERFTDALLELARDDTLVRQLSECGRSRASAFTWRDTAERVTELYETIASRGRP